MDSEQNLIAVLQKAQFHILLAFLLYFDVNPAPVRWILWITQYRNEKKQLCSITEVQSIYWDLLGFISIYFELNHFNTVPV